MDVEVKNEEVADDGQIPILIEPKQEVEDTVELIEPKVELIDVKIEEEIDDTEYQHLIPYEYRDYLEQHTEEQPTSSRKRAAHNSSTPERDLIKCLKCGRKIMLTNLGNLKTHVLSHSGLKLYECPVKQCSYSSHSSTYAISHMKHKHKSCTDKVRKNEMSDEDRQVLKALFLKCYPDLKEIKFHDRNIICQLCHKSVKDRQQDKIAHSNGHIDPLLFKCDDQDCDFSTNFVGCLLSHSYSKHLKGFDSNDMKLLQIKEGMTIRKWNNMCFGDLSKEDPIETVEYPDPVAKKFVKTEYCSYYCQVCQKGVNERRDHASEHLDIMLYKCSLPNCQIQTTNQTAMIDHEVNKHGILLAFSGKCRIPLTTAQIDKVDRMLVQCFPESNKK